MPQSRVFLEIAALLFMTSCPEKGTGRETTALLRRGGLCSLGNGCYWNKFYKHLRNNYRRNRDSNDKKISWYISHGRSYNSLLEWYGGGAVPPMIAFSGASMGNCRRYSALAVPIQSNSALAVPSYFLSSHNRLSCCCRTNLTNSSPWTPALCNHCRLFSNFSTKA